jgi:hypothetical protein
MSMTATCGEKAKIIATALWLGVLAGQAFAASEAGALPENSWVKVVDVTGAHKPLSSTWYMPATDEFICWGKSGFNGPQSVYDVETFRLGDRTWRESFPLGKEDTWSKRRFPNWPTQGYWSGMNRSKERVNQLKHTSPDTVIRYDPVHRVLFHFDVGNTVHLMRYDDTSVKVVGDDRDQT